MNADEFEQYKVSLQNMFDVAIEHLDKWGVKQESLDVDQQKVVSDLFSAYDKRMSLVKENIQYTIEMQEIENALGDITDECC